MSKTKKTVAESTDDYKNMDPFLKKRLESCIGALIDTGDKVTFHEDGNVTVEKRQRFY